MMGEPKVSTMAMANRERDRELLIAVAGESSDDPDSKPSSSAAAAAAHHHHHHHHSGREAFHNVLRSWASKKFMTGCKALSLDLLSKEDLAS
ncbi:Protein CONTINUOUS VASCULAR RING 1 [Ananas comosus]|uniref:Protein CONTINUOUS VASCULAR RING 1 n=1 Tax=Ananas comosus TaxID=4615 RepID=A0A199VTJ8_ANACO|nr:Protein CONTINUOUS VASCULAR RING 1 [Ananas comosus]